MEPLERILCTVSHQRPDRPAIDITSTPEARENLKKHLRIEDDELLLKRLGADIRRVGPRYVGPSDMMGAGGGGAAGRDFLGVVWKAVKNEYATYNEVAYSPLTDAKTVREIEEYSWPSVDWFDFSHLSEEIDGINRDQRYAVLFFAGGAFETPWYMRGLERFLMDLVECPDIAEALSFHAMKFYKARALKAIEQSKGKIDMIGSGGDIGTQRGIMVSPDSWRKHIKPNSTELIRTFKDMGFVTFYHSCGSLVPVIEDLIEMGLDILDPIQPKADGMNPENLIKNYAGRLSFHGGIDEQELLPNGTPEEVRKETERLIDILGSDGGYIVSPSHAFQPDTPPENIMAIYDTALNYQYS